MAEKIWESPDGRIRKEIINNGISEFKPTEDCQCSIKISSCSSEIEKYSCVTSVVIGESNNNFERLLHSCLTTMNIEEIARVTFRHEGKISGSFTLQLLTVERNGQIYEWNANKKYSLAMKHKVKGSELFNETRYVDASYRFGKGLKVLCSIPIEVDEAPEEIDGIKVIEISDLKAVLYNNLASCYLKHCDYENVLKLCLKVLEKDNTNVKALYKLAVAKYETHDYEGSKENLLQLLDLDPKNKAAVEKLKFVNAKVTESNVRVNTMIKKMFHN